MDGRRDTSTSRGAVRSAVKCGADMLNIHAVGGLDMARVAVAARDEAFAEYAGEAGLSEKPLLFAVTPPAPSLMAARMARLRARAVLPIAGRAAMMIRSEGWSPRVMASSSG